MYKKSFEEVWTLICKHSGGIFKTKKSKEFTYTIQKEYVIPSRKNYKIDKKDFEKAYRMMPLDGPGVINDVIRGPSYVWAILNDNRIFKK
ncbi:MAG: hypothetical protein N4A64_15670 [Marinisporobacter sp.]|jgi:hypothetical protein|nr:hypothetical protein [Marinisporobacter sp.]